MTVATPKTAPSIPWYLPRSRNGMMSAISAIAVTIRPPAPIPCTARHETSQVIELASPHSADASDEERGAQLEDALAAEQVAELAGQRRRDRVGDQVRRDDPGHVRPTAEVADDGRQRRRDDRLVERGQQHAQRDRAEEDVHLPTAQRALAPTAVGWPPRLPLRSLRRATPKRHHHGGGRRPRSRRPARPARSSVGLPSPDGLDEGGPPSRTAFVAAAPTCPDR